MIKTFISKGLQELFDAGKTGKINKTFHARIIERLDVLDAAVSPQGMAIQGYNFHPLKDFNPTRYSVHVNGPWCITFEFDGPDAVRVNFEQYH